MRAEAPRAQKQRWASSSDASLEIAQFHDVSEIPRILELSSKSVLNTAAMALATQPPLLFLLLLLVPHLLMLHKAALVATKAFS